MNEQWGWPHCKPFRTLLVDKSGSPHPHLGLAKMAELLGKKE